MVDLEISFPDESKRTTSAPRASCPSRNTVAETGKVSPGITFTGTNSPPKKVAGEISATGIRLISQILLYFLHLPL
jgi:hypothetical protein